MMFKKRFLKGQSLVALVISLGVLAAVGVGAYYYFNSGTIFPSGLTGLEKIGFILDQKPDVSSFHYTNALKLEVSSGGESSFSFSSTIKYFKSGNDSKTYVNIGGLSSLFGIKALEFYHYNNSYYDCRITESGEECTKSSVKDSSFFSVISTNTTYLDSMKVLEAKSLDKENHTVNDYLNINYIGKESSLGRICSKFEVTPKDLFTTKLNSSSSFTLDFCIDDYLSFVHYFTLTGKGSGSLGALSLLSGSKGLSNDSGSSKTYELTFSIQTSDFGTKVSSDDLTIPKTATTKEAPNYTQPLPRTYPTRTYQNTTTPTKKPVIVISDAVKQFCTDIGAPANPDILRAFYSFEKDAQDDYKLSMNAGDSLNTEPSPTKILDGILFGQAQRIIPTGNGFKVTTFLKPFDASKDFAFGGWFYVKNDVTNIVANGTNGFVAIDVSPNKYVYVYYAPNQHFGINHASSDWMHVLVVRKNGVLTLWINGKPVDSVDDSIDYGTIQDIHTNISNAPFDGWIDNFKAYSGALTDEMASYEYQCVKKQ